MSTAVKTLMRPVVVSTEPCISISTYTCACSCAYIYLGQLVAYTGRRQPWEKCGAVSDDGNNYKRLLTMKIRVRSVVLIETAGKYWIIDSFISKTCISCLLYNHNKYILCWVISKVRIGC